MEFWGVELKPKKPYRLSRVDYGGTRLHISQATLGGKVSTGRSIVRCKVGDGPVVYLCSLLPGVQETSSLDLYFEDDITLSVKGNTSVHLVGYFEPFEDANYPGDDCEEDGYSDEDEEEEMSENDSMNDFIVEDDSDSEDEDVDYEDNEESTTDEDEPIMVPNKGVTIEEMSDDDVKAKVGSENKSIVPVKSGNKKNKKAAIGDDSKNGENGTDPSKQEANGVSKDQEKSDKDTNTESEDEDGFPLNNKRKLRDDENEQPYKKRSTEAREGTPETTETGTDSELTPMKTDTPSESAKKKKKKKKNKKDKNECENTDIPSPVQKKDKKDSESAVDTANKKGTVKKFPNGLEVENVSMGKPDGKQAQKGKKVGMIYTGRLKSNGKIFDSNVGKKPLFFRLGVGQVIKGWDVGVTGMRVGDKRKLTIPPQMAYGSKALPGIPANSWLVFDVQLVEVK